MDKEKFNEALGGEPNEDGIKDLFGGEVYEDNGIITASEYEANYGYYDERDTLAKAGLIYEGHSGTGGGYGPQVFCAIDGWEYACDVAFDGIGQPVVEINEDGEPYPDQLKQARQFIEARKRVRKYLQTGILETVETK